MLHSALLVPGSAEVFASSNVGDGVGHSALQKAKARNAECGIDGNAVGSVSVKQCGYCALTVGRTNPAHGHLGSVRSRRPKPSRHVATRVVTSHHFLHFFDHLLASDHIKIVGRGRSRQRSVDVAQRARRRRRVRGCVQRVRLFGHSNGVFRTHGRIPRPHHNAQQSKLALFANHEVVKQVDALKQYIVPVRNHFRPIPRAVFRRLKQCEIGSAPEVASNPPARSVVAR